MGRLRIDLFVEDSAHEQLLSALVNRLAHEEGCSIDVRPLWARRGHGRVLAELEAHQLVAKKSAAGLADILVVGVDANCKRFAQARADIAKTLRPEFVGRAVIACPDPHIERWYMADVGAVAKVLGAAPRVPRKKCEKDYYKTLLRNAVRDAGHFTTLGGIEYAEDIVNAIDWYAAGKSEPSFKSFVDALRSAFRRLRSQGD